MDGCLSLLTALQYSNHLLRVQPTFTKTTGRDSPVTLRAGGAAIENGWLEINQAKLSLRSNQAALSHSLLLFGSQVWTL